MSNWTSAVSVSVMLSIKRLIMSVTVVISGLESRDEIISPGDDDDDDKSTPLEIGLAELLLLLFSALFLPRVSLEVEVGGGGGG